jgi:beta-glucosidase
MHTCEPATDRSEDIEATARYGHVNRWWLDPIHGRGFPADMAKVYRAERPGTAETIATAVDWEGVNYYSPAIISDQRRTVRDSGRRHGRHRVPPAGVRGRDAGRRRLGRSPRRAAGMAVGRQGRAVGPPG